MTIPSINNSFHRSLPQLTTPFIDLDSHVDTWLSILVRVPGSSQPKYSLSSLLHRYQQLFNLLPLTLVPLYQRDVAYVSQCVWTAPRQALCIESPFHRPCFKNVDARLATLVSMSGCSEPNTV